ncbi:MAG: FAD:protein FMN transferase [Flavobacteriaceae bacterium]
MHKIILLWGSLLILFSSHAQQLFQKKFQKMGSSFEITVVDSQEDRALEMIALAIEEIDRIERLISSWQLTSETTEINQNAGLKAVVVSKELLELISRANIISDLVYGNFDISYASIDHLWNFNGKEVELPSEEILQKAVAKIGYKKIQIDTDQQTVFLPQKGMKIGFGAIGKGYAADRVKRLLISKGVKAGIVNASGDMSAWGKQPNGDPWQIGLVNPMNKNKVFSWFSLNENAVVTSGDYERYLTIAGKRYGHIINPKTGKPSQGVISCTVFAPKAELADALATAIFVMGIDLGIDLINKLPNIEALMIDDAGKIFTSKNIDLDETT